MQQPREIVLEIPGQWSTRSDVVASIAGKSEGYFYAGDRLVQAATGQVFKLAIQGHDPDLQRAFALAGRRSLRPEHLDAIGAHTFVLYLAGPGGSVEAARSTMEAVCGLLKAGGCAVKVESSGVAHSAADWLRLAAQGDMATLYRAYVTLIHAGTAYYSCGMHTLGRRDAIIYGDLPPQDATRLLHSFLLYTLVEHPALQSGHTFSLDIHAPRYRLVAEPCATYPPDDLFYNPFGMWRLKRHDGQD
jgi:hypothetical protein